MIMVGDDRQEVSDFRRCWDFVSSCALKELSWTNKSNAVLLGCYVVVGIDPKESKQC